VITIAIYGSLEAWVAASYTRVAIDNSFLNYLFPLATFSLVACIALYAVQRRLTLSRGTTCAIYAACVLQLLVALIAGGRSVLLFYLFSLLVAHGRIRLPRWVTLTAVAVIAVTISGSMVFLRYQQQAADARFTLNLRNVISASYTGLPYIDHFQLARDYVARNGHDFGGLYAKVLLLPVPRQLWADKPLQLSRRMREEYWGDSSGGIPPGYFGEAFIAFGWPGVIAASLVFGGLLRHLSHRFPLRPSSGPYIISIAAVTGYAIGFVLIRGGLDIGAYRVGLIVASLWLVTRIIFPSKQQVKG